MSYQNQLFYKGRTFLNEDIAIGSFTNNLLLHSAPISEELKPDTFIFHLVYEKNKKAFLQDVNGKYLQTSDGKFLVVKSGDTFDPEDFKFGDTVSYIVEDDHTHKLIGYFYPTSVTRVARNVYRVECISELGLLTYKGHKGGMYKNDYVGNVLMDIMDGVGFIVDDDLSNELVTGYLPKVSTARDNLLALLFMTGATVKTWSTTLPFFTYLGSGAASVIPDTSIDVIGSVSKSVPVTRVEVTAHEYISSSDDEVITLFDNTNGDTVTNQVVDFPEPCHDLRWNGSPLPPSWAFKSNANYATVTGQGVLTGKKYTHVTSVYSIDNGSIALPPNVIRVTNNYLINPMNVANVAKRIAGYYGVAKEASCLIRLDPANFVRPGEKVTFKDPWGDQHTGFIKEMNMQLSQNLNANVKVAVDWTPGPFGASYTASRVFGASDISNGTLTIPSGMVGKQARVVLISGAGGGQGGYDGTAGTAPSGQASFNVREPGPGGTGGAPGEPGTRPKVVSFYESALPASYSGAAIGTGGAGGARNGGLGSAGGATTLNGYTTADGYALIADYVDMFTGKAYGQLNTTGVKGGDGGIGAGFATQGMDTSTKGENVGTASGGAYANPCIYDYKQGSNARRYREMGGAGGGGAANGRNGSPGYTSTDYATEQTKDGSWGGDGANAVAPAKASATTAGKGGHGGGGGGGSAQCRYKTDGGLASFGYNHAGAGGQGSVGGQGGDGIIIIYYNA